jgi:hypothetical protein
MGDHLELHLIIEKPVDITVILPDPPGIFPDGIEMTELPRTDTTIRGDHQLIDQKFTFAAFDTGFFQIPSIPVIFKTVTLKIQ